MKFVGEYKEHLFTADGAIMVVFAARNGEKAEAMETIAKLEKARLDAQKPVKYEITIKRYYPKRSINANNYCWQLLSQLSKKLGVTKEDLYRKYILDFGLFDEVKVRTEAVESFIRIWQSNGLGWIAEKVDTIGNDTVLWLYPGSSTFDSKTMHDFILAIVNDCKLEGIETRTPEEIAQMEGIREPKR